MDTRHLSVHSAYLAGENATELENQSWNGFGKENRQNAQSIIPVDYWMTVDAVQGSLLGLSCIHVLLFGDSASGDDQVCGFAFFYGTGEGADAGQLSAPFGSSVEGE